MCPRLAWWRQSFLLPCCDVPPGDRYIYTTLSTLPGCQGTRHHLDGPCLFLPNLLAGVGPFKLSQPYSVLVLTDIFTFPPASVESGVWSDECGISSVECGMGSEECGLWIVDCGLWSVECGVYSVECGVWPWVIRQDPAPLCSQNCQQGRRR